MFEFFFRKKITKKKSVFSPKFVFSRENVRKKFFIKFFFVKTHCFRSKNFQKLQILSIDIIENFLKFIIETGKNE